ncbi:hypothetical protein [Actinotalea fermentans]|uniref:Uncharacterized protein n=1 Tax=Actinotalea fermentans TaxID=43671 RepID=A0A511YY33_9CELL|nr:hypothetical protein [Actinotalea fermentans]GEN80099.1 hypothetical protein AFE02nite_18330 [Actinotalea fermentans]
MTTHDHRPLGRALEQAVEDAARAHDARTAAGAGLDLGAARASARRRRTRFDAGLGAAAAAVVAVTFLAAGALQRDDAVAPPAETATPTPTSVTPEPRAGVGCGTRLDALPEQPDGAPDVSVQVEVAQPTVRVGDPIEATVTTTVVMDPSLPHSYTFGVWLVRDGVVVGWPKPGWTDEGRPTGSREDASVETREVRAQFFECVAEARTPMGPADFDLVAVMEDVQVDGGPASAPAVSNLVVVHVGEGTTDQGDQGDTANQEWFARFVGDEGWADVDPASVPGDLPLSLDDGDRVIRSQAYEDGLHWRVTLSYAHGLDAYERARGALAAAGYVLEEERTDPDRPFWTAGTFTRGAVTVHVDTSNETGEGFYTDFFVEASW